LDVELDGRGAVFDIDSNHSHFYDRCVTGAYCRVPANRNGYSTSTQSGRGRSLRRHLAILASTLFCTVTITSAEVTVQVIATDPESPAVLALQQHFSLRIGYTTDQPIRLRAQPLLGGQRVPAMSGGSPRGEPGTGEAFYWLAASDDRRVDAIMVTAETENGRILAQTTIPVDLNWTAQPIDNSRVPPEWMQRMKADQDRHTRGHDAAFMQGTTGWLMNVIGFAVMACIPVYFILQSMLMWRLRDRWRKAAAVPLLPMSGVLAYTVYAYLDGSNLYPVVLILLSPFAVFYLLAVAFLWRSSGKQA
jgi:hypothetical protein